MKFYGNILLALCVVQGTAFVTNKPKASFAPLAASIPTQGSAPAASGRQQAIEDRLKQTQKVLESRIKELEKTGEPAATKTSDRTVEIQGGSLKTWTFPSPKVERVSVSLGTDGRPMEVDVVLWQGPDNTPEKIRVYVEDGAMRPFNAVLETPRGPNTVAIRNTGHMEFPLAANVVADNAGAAQATAAASSPQIIQGGALRTYPFDTSVESVQILLKTDGRPLHSRIELLQGPNNNKQIVELYTEDGLDRPFYAVIETPGSGNVVRVVNTATVEYPLRAWVQPGKVGSSASEFEAVIGGDQDGGFVPDREWSADAQW